MAAVCRASVSTSLKGATTGTILVRDLALLSGDSNDYVTVERCSFRGRQTSQTLLHCGHISIIRWLNAIGAIVKRRSYLELKHKIDKKTKE